MIGPQTSTTTGPAATIPQLMRQVWDQVQLKALRHAAAALVALNDLTSLPFEISQKRQAWPMASQTAWRRSPS
jgi:hypothetical protein